MSINVQNLTKRYGPLAVVDDISFAVATGEFVSLLGPSGCGKTTTLRCIAGLEEASGGVIRIGDETVSAPAAGVMIPPDQRDVGMVFQSYAIWPHMSVEANVGFPLAIRGAAAEEVRREAERALDIVALRHLKDRQPSQLSGGQQQRVALARAIVGKPKILLFDEPLSNLDAKLREGTRSEIRRLQRELGVAAIYVTHDQTEALSMSDRVIVMNTGKIVQEGTPKDLYRRPIDRFVADFVGHASFIDLRRDGESWKTRDGTPIMVAESEVRPGARYQAMLRPESIKLGDSSAAKTADRENVLRGRIDESHYMGAYTEYLVEAAGAMLKVHDSTDIELGQEVMLSFSREDCRLIATE